MAKVSGSSASCSLGAFSRMNTLSHLKQSWSCFNVFYSLTDFTLIGRSEMSVYRHFSLLHSPASTSQQLLCRVNSSLKLASQVHNPSPNFRPRKLLLSLPQSQQEFVMARTSNVIIQFQHVNFPEGQLQQVPVISVCLYSPDTQKLWRGIVQKNKQDTFPGVVSFGYLFFGLALQ
mmetsp:Transcript_120447/g.209692  ORF Transcript_120447/g.209692 Transcript_120447/m.209692 type:complete len:175 (-) Transcript_120447:404-928(-)